MQFQSTTTECRCPVLGTLSSGATSRTKPRGLQIPFLFQLASKMVGAILYPCVLKLDEIYGHPRLFVHQTSVRRWFTVCLSPTVTLWTLFMRNSHILVLLNHPLCESWGSAGPTAVAGCQHNVAVVHVLTTKLN